MEKQLVSISLNCLPLCVQSKRERESAPVPVPKTAMASHGHQGCFALPAVRKVFTLQILRKKTLSFIFMEGHAFQAETGWIRVTLFNKISSTILKRYGFKESKLCFTPDRTLGEYHREATSQRSRLGLCVDKGR